jgi:hypothetical protein
VRTRKPTQNPADVVLRKAFGIAMALQASSSNNSPRKLAREAIQKIQSYLEKLPPEASGLVWVEEAKGRYMRENRGGPLCEMMIPPRGRLDGGGYFAAILLKVLVVAHLDTKGTHLPLNLKAWQRAAEQDPSTSGLRAAVRGHERQLSDALTSLFRTTHGDGQSRFTDLCRPCVEALNELEAIALPGGTGASRLPKEIAGELFGKLLVGDLTLETADADLKVKRANALSKLGKALQHKVEFLKAGGRKNG